MPPGLTTVWVDGRFKLAKSPPAACNCTSSGLPHRATATLCGVRGLVQVAQHAQAWTLAVGQGSPGRESFLNPTAYILLPTYDRGVRGPLVERASPVPWSPGPLVARASDDSLAAVRIRLREADVPSTLKGGCDAANCHVEGCGALDKIRPCRRYDHH